MIALRPHQETAITALRRSFATGHRRPMLQAPTGAGKTIIAAYIANGVMQKGRKVAFLVPYVSLIDQTVQRFKECGLADVGVIQADHPGVDPTAPIQVCSLDTLSRRDQHPACDLVVVDEAHRNSQWLFRWMDRDTELKFIGLSATPWARGLAKHFDDLVIGETTAGLIEAGYLSPFRVFAPSHPDLSGVKTVAGEFHQGQLGDAMGDDALVADIIGTWLQRAEGRPTLVFAVNRAHAKALQERFLKANVPAGYIDAYTPSEDRKDVGDRFNAKELPVVVNVGCLVAGVDWDVRCIQMARPTKSEIFHVQSIGRGLRTAPGKEDCLILDHSDNHLRLGFVTDIIHDELDDGQPRGPQEREERERLPKECPSCAFLKPPKVTKCPACGFKPERQNDVEEAAGELREIKPKKAVKPKPRPVTREVKEAFFSELVALGEQRGYQPGWAAHQYREKFGVWPRQLKVYPVEPSQAVKNWVKSRMIARAHRQKQEAA